MNSQTQISLSLSKNESNIFPEQRVYVLFVWNRDCGMRWMNRLRWSRMLLMLPTFKMMSYELSRRIPGWRISRRRNFSRTWMGRSCLLQRYISWLGRWDWWQLFNQYADPLGYFEICLEIFQAADFRQTTEINQCWDSIIRKGISIVLR